MAKRKVVTCVAYRNPFKKIAYAKYLASRDAIFQTLLSMYVSYRLYC
jgi:hypothetical protein